MKNVNTPITCKCGKQFIPLDDPKRKLCVQCLKMARADANFQRMAFGKEFK